MRTGKHSTRPPWGIGVVVGAVVAALAGCGTAADDRPPQWSFISPAIVEPSCATANCHSALAQRAGVDLSTPKVGYQTLTDRHFVVGSDTAQSSLLFLLRAQGTNRMPPDFPLPEADIALIEHWIANGAADN